MEINILGKANKQIKEYSKNIALSALCLLDVNAELTIKFVSSFEIKRLNNNFRSINKVTDVLSFPATNTKAGEKIDPSEEYLGDMAICLRRAKSQAKQYGNTTKQEVKKLIIHSILHMLGYDHILDEDYLIMQKKEEELDKLLKV